MALRNFITLSTLLLASFTTATETAVSKTETSISPTPTSIPATSSTSSAVPSSSGPPAPTKAVVQPNQHQKPLAPTPDKPAPDANLDYIKSILSKFPQSPSLTPKPKPVQKNESIAKLIDQFRRYIEKKKAEKAAAASTSGENTKKPLDLKALLQKIKEKQQQRKQAGDGPEAVTPVKKKVDIKAILDKIQAQAEAKKTEQVKRYLSGEDMDAEGEDKAANIIMDGLAAMLRKVDGWQHSGEVQGQVEKQQEATTPPAPVLKKMDGPNQNGEVKYKQQQTPLAPQVTEQKRDVDHEEDEEKEAALIEPVLKGAQKIWNVVAKRDVPDVYGYIAARSENWV